MTAVVPAHHVYAGDQRATALYKESEKVWPPPSWQPSDLGAALWAWWDASDLTTITNVSGGVSQWRDKSPNNRHVAQGTAANRPGTGLRTLNGLNTLSFPVTGVPNLIINPVTLVQPFTVAVVAVYDNLDALTRHIVATVSAFQVRTQGGRWNMFAGNAVTGSLDDALPHMFVATFNGATSSLRKNGAVDASGNASTLGVPATSFIISRTTATTCWQGQIAEVIIATTVLTPTELAAIETYLSDKWGL